MIRLSDCDECGSSKFRIGTYVRVLVPYEKYTGKITKEQLLADDEIELLPEPTIETELYCAECGKRVEREISLSGLQSADLCDEIKSRIERMEEDRAREAFGSYMATVKDFDE